MSSQVAIIKKKPIMHLLQHSLMGVLELRDLLESTESPEKEVLWVLRGLGESLGYLASTDKKGTLVNEDRRANQGFPPLYQVGLLSKAFVRSVLRFFFFFTRNALCRR